MSFVIFQILPDADRAGLIDDAFNLARGGYLNYSVALDITKYLGTDDQHLPWDSARMGMTYIKNMLTGGVFGLWRVRKLFYQRKK